MHTVIMTNNPGGANIGKYFFLLTYNYYYVMLGLVHESTICGLRVDGLVPGGYTI